MGIDHYGWHTRCVTTTASGIGALYAMRTNRRQRRVADVEWFEALYRVYISAFIGSSAVLFLSSLVGDNRFTPNEWADISHRGPHAIGLVMALVVFLGMRSGVNGGPISVEEAEVRHVLLSPVSRAAALRHPAIQQLRAFAFGGSITGAISGQLFSRRAPTTMPHMAWWILWGALGGAIVAGTFVVAALLVHTYGVHRWLITAVGTILFGWQAATLANSFNFSGPFDFVGHIALYPIRGAGLGFIGLVIILGIGALAVIKTGTLSLEALARRSALVSQMKFAVTLQDVRTVVLLRRQLSQEFMRVTPWIKISPLLRRDIIVGRGFRSVMHFPLRRIVRMTLLTVCGAVALIVTDRGTTPALLIAGICFFIVGLDAVEPLSQEVDQPDRTDALPIERGLLMTKHLIVPALSMFPFLLVGVLVAVVYSPTITSLLLSIIIGIPALLAGVAGASINAVKGAPDPVGGANQGLALPPEMSGMTTLIRAIFPPVVSIVGCLPVIVVHYSETSNTNVYSNSTRAAVAVGMMLVVIAGWVRQRDHIRAWFLNAQAESKSSTSSSLPKGD